jgi:multiple antibiotic resistance protein
MKPVSVTRMRCFGLPLPTVIAVLVGALGLFLGLSVLDNFPALADVLDVPGLEQIELTSSRQGMQNLAQEMVEKNFEDQFGLFNLFIIFFVTLGPLKVIPVFIQLTRNAQRSLKRQLAFRSTAVATVVILVVVLIGRNILDVWQIQLTALMIAGGILLSIVALQLVLTQYSPQTSQSPPPENPELSLAIQPLAFPTILPPFGIAIALTLMVVATEVGLSIWAVIALLVLIMGLNLGSMLAAGPIFKFIRPVTLKILGFTLGVMQFALGIQFILSGLEIQIMVIRILLQTQ